MADTSISSLILFIAAVTIAAGVAGTMAIVVEDISSSVDVRGDNVAEEVQSDFSIISDTGSDAVYDDENSEITLLVKNTGDTPLTPDANTIDILVNGEYVNADTVETLDSPSSTWRPGEVARITLDHSLAEGEHRIKVHINGNEDTVIIFV